MPEHPHTGRLILVAAAALFAAAAAQAAPKDSPAKDTGKDASPAIKLDQLGGTWKNAKSGVNVRIEQGASGWQVWFSTSGEARITLPEKNRPAIKIDGHNFTCSYSVTLPTAQTMKWDLTQGKPEAQCLTGVFTKLEPVPNEVKRAAPQAPEAKQAAKTAPAPVEQPAEAKKPPQAATVIEPSPTSPEKPLWSPAETMPRHAGYRRPPVRLTIHHRGWRIAPATRWRYAASRYRHYHHYRHRYRWYLVFVPRCGCH